MPLTPERQRQLLLARGLDPDKFELIPAEQDSPLSNVNASPLADPSNAPMGVSTTAAQALGAHAAASALPTAGALAGGAGLTALGIALAPETFGASLIPSIALGLLGAAGGGAATSYAQNKLLPKKATDYLAQTQAEHPYASFGGELLPSALAFNPVKSIANLPTLARGAGKLIASPASSAVLSTAEKLALQNAAVNVGGNVGIDAVQQAVGDAPYDPVQSLKAAGQGLLFSEPTKAIGKRLFGFHGTPTLESRAGVDVAPRTVEDVLKARLTQEAAQKAKVGDSADVTTFGQHMVKDNQLIDESTALKPAAESARVIQELSPTEALSAEQTRKIELDKVEAEKLKQENDAREAALKTATPQKFSDQEEELLTQLEKEKGPQFQPVSEVQNPEPFTADEQAALVVEQTRRAHKAGINTTTDFNLRNEKGELVHGEYDPTKRLAKSSSNTIKPAAEDTLSHETWHGRLLDWMTSSNPKDQKLARDLMAAHGHSEELTVKALAEDEHARIISRLRNPEMKARFKTYIKDYSSRIKTAFGSKNPETLKRQANVRAEYDAPYGLRTDILPEYATSTPVSKKDIQTESSATSKEGNAAEASLGKSEIRHQEESSKAPELKDAPVVYKAYWDAMKVHLYNLTEDAGPSLPKGSTVTERTLLRHGLKIPAAEKLKEQIPPSSEVEVKHQHESVTPGLLPFLTAENNKPAQEIKTPQAKDLSEGLNKFTAFKHFLSDRLSQHLIMPFEKLPAAQQEQLYHYRWDIDDHGKSDITLNAEQAKANESITKVLQDFRTYHNKIGPMIHQGDKVRPGGMKPEGYQFNMWDPDKLATLMEKPGSAQAKAIEDAYVEHLVSKEVDPTEAKQMFSDYVKALGSNRARPSFETEFGAVRKAEGYGLPWSLVDPNFTRASIRYARRAGTDVAFFKHIQKDPNMLKMLGLRDQLGNEPVSDYPIYATHPAVIKASQSLLGYSDSTINPVFASATRSVGSAVMGIGTALRNLVQAPSAALAHAGWSDAIKSIALDQKTIARAREAGAVKARFSDFDTLENLGDLGTTKTIVKMLDAFSNTMRKVQGRDFSDKLEAEYHYAIGEKLAADWFAAAKSNPQALKMLKLHGLIVDDLQAKINGQLPIANEDIQKVAKSVTDAGRGTYDSRGLPTWAMHGQLAPFFALSRWSIEKSNTIKRDVLMPATQGNFAPLLRYTLGTLLTGAAIEQLNSVLSGKRNEDPTLKETVEFGNTEAKLAKAIGLFQLGSFGGILSDSAKLAMRAAQGKDLTYSNPASMPLYTWATETIGRNIADASGAIKDGEDKFDVAGKLITSILTQSIQSARYISAYANPQDTNRKERFRDMRVFNELVEDKSPSSSTGRPNDFEDIEAKKFKRTDDIEEALKLVPEMLSKAIAKAGNDPYKLSAELRKLKNNNYQTMPSPETFPTSFARYILFLRSTQGEEKASEVMQDYFRRNTVNKVKSEMVPSL